MCGIRSFIPDKVARHATVVEDAQVEPYTKDEKKV